MLKSVKMSTRIPVVMYEGTFSLISLVIGDQRVLPSTGPPLVDMAGGVFDLLGKGAQVRLKSYRPQTLRGARRLVLSYSHRETRMTVAWHSQSQLPCLTTDNIFTKAYTALHQYAKRAPTG